ncbi:helix-turn-helix domain-containing protein [Paenibacillus sedimenti]|uniref:AraC family transcriptional regulator n=1 Tax=Paenibacillus sedimenti TaxID=2770274 RepID=A0A926QMM7_9BACL|nr:helix-turn-helix domain-containing protein [Paenibacillus sedimenti]MBD0383529.1 AraC family transcriptional regulator [Paenibacillus sedimenti]
MQKRNSVFTNLAISYVTIVLVIVLLLCSIFYMYVPRDYNEEIRTKNQMVLENAANYIETAVFQRVEKIYLDLSLGKSANIDLYTKNTLQGNYSRIIDIQDLLKNEVANNSDLVYAVHLFYTKQNVMISSVYGLNYYDDRSKDAFLAMDWIDRMRSNEKSFLWMETRRVPQDIYTSMSGNNSMNPLITYAHSYPFNSTGENSELMIAIDIKEAAVSHIIQDIMPSDYKNTFIIGKDGKIISAADKGILGRRTINHSYINTILSSNAAAESFNDTIEHIPYVVSHHKFLTNEWKIYNITPSNNYYQKSIFLQKIVLLICLLAIIVGIVLSGIFTIASYNPLKRLMGKIKGVFDHTAENGLNEYTLIDTAIHKLTNKVSSLEETLQTNHPVIKHNVVLNMLNNSYSPEELVEQLQSLHVSMKYSHFCCMVIDPASKGFKELNSKSIQYVLYRLINQLEASSFHESHIIAEELPDKKIVVIVCTNNPEDWLIETLSGFILSKAKNSFGLDFKISLGHWVHECIDVHKSYAEALILIKYSYFMPEISMIKDVNLLNRETSNHEIPQSVLLKFKEKLQARSLVGVVEAIDHLIEHMKEGVYAADYCHYILLNTVSVYSDYLKSVRYTSDGMDLFKQYTSIYSINGFREWFVHSITEFLSHMDKRSEDRNMETIEAVKSYISSHLSEELSLDTVAGKVFISPKYLSKIFKEETGINYTDYVTKKRMERALELMAQSSMTIEQIANTVGYGTAAYFIKKFKEINGCTPKTYVRSLMKQA